MNVAQLAQAYIHLKPYKASDKELKRLGRFAERISVKIAGDIYGGGVAIDVELEEGSLRTRVTVIGSIMLATYGTIGGYKGFKESVVELCNDARDFAVDVCGPVVAKAGVEKEEVYRFERRLKTPGKIYRLSKRLETIERSIGDLSPKAIQAELAKARFELDALAGDLSQEEMHFVREKLPPKKLPKPSDWPEQELPRVALKPDEFSQTVLYLDDAELQGDQPDPKRRIVFHQRTEVAADRKPKPRLESTERSLLIAPPIETTPRNSR